jgi:glycosyltransferase involved in cell wall biosynthesis
LSFIVGHNRDRDHYEVALAFAERDLLDVLVTDYWKVNGGSLLPALKHRRRDGIRDDQVVTSRSAFYTQVAHQVQRKFAPSAQFPSARVDSAIGRRVRQVSLRRPDARLLVYNGYAHEAFTPRDVPTRLLYQFHPTTAGVLRRLADDELADAADWVEEPEEHDAPREARALAEIDSATGYLCASETTRQSLIETGVAGHLIRVTPYGLPPARRGARTTTQQQCEFLFLGQGVRRKGLHLLLAAWREAKLTDSILTIMGPALDPAIAELARYDPTVRFEGQVSRSVRDDALARCDTLVLPSLVEGFGLVIGEALASGMRVIASSNTGLPDLAAPHSCSTTVAPGRVAPLVEALRKARETYVPGADYSEAAFAFADHNSWSRYRSGVFADAAALTA